MKKETLDAYFAGLFDGEGTIYLAKKGAAGIKPTITINMTCEKTIRAVHEHFGVGTVRPKPKPGSWKDQWIWRAYYNDARYVVGRLEPYLITKREAAQVLLSHSPKKRGRLRKEDILTEARPCLDHHAGLTLPVMNASGR